MKRQLPTHHALMALFDRGKETACAFPLHQLPGYWVPTCSGRIVRVEVFVCMKCDRALECTRGTINFVYPFGASHRPKRRA